MYFASYISNSPRTKDLDPETIPLDRPIDSYAGYKQDVFQTNGSFNYQRPSYSYGTESWVDVPKPMQKVLIIDSGTGPTSLRQICPIYWADK